MVSGASELLGRLVELGSSDDDGPRPDVISYNTVLAAWSKSAGVRPGESPSAGGREEHRRGRRVVGEFAAHEALRLLDEIEGRYLQSVESKTHGRSLAVKPDVISYKHNHRRIREMPRSTARMERPRHGRRKRYSPE